MLVERSMKAELDMVDRSSLPDFERELEDSDNPLQDLVDSVKEAIASKKKDITYH